MSPARTDPPITFTSTRQRDASMREGAGIALNDLRVQGLCSADGGLYVPSAFPAVSLATLRKWRPLSFCDLAFEVLSLYMPSDVIGTDALRSMIARSFATFDCGEVTPIVSLGGGLHLLELYRGQTLSFKDVALSFLGNFLEHILAKHAAEGACAKPVLVLGATSGDTGSAAIAGLDGKANVNVIILYPAGRVSPIQELQMVAGKSANVHCLACPGSFDDCQSLVKEAFENKELAAKVTLLGVNSINVIRILVQTVYYFYSYLRVTPSIGEPVTYAVPTGNFGDVLAAYYAKRMGLPVGALIVATNSNDILTRFMRGNGTYAVAGPVLATAAPSMDIQVSSNFERYLYEIAGRDTARVRQWMERISGRDGSDRTFTVSPEEKAAADSDFSSYTIDEETCRRTIVEVAHRTSGALIIDPHTAIGVAAALAFRDDSVGARHGPIVCCATAHPAKFPSFVAAALTSDVRTAQHAAPLDGASEWLTHPRVEALRGKEERKFSLSSMTMADLASFISLAIK